MVVLYEDKAEGMPGAAGSVALPQATPRYPPGDLAIWVFILAELVFAIFFAAYAFTRMHNVALFDEFQATLNRDAALINTVALLTSSYLVARGMVAVREGDHRLCARWLWGAVGMGALLLVVKGGEYADHFVAGVNLSTNSFYMFYLSLTFFHFMHVILGMVILAAVALKARRLQRRRPRRRGERRKLLAHGRPCVADPVPAGLCDALTMAEFTPQPTRRLIRPRTLVFAPVLALTCVTWAVGRLGLEGLGVSLLVLAFALLKGQLIDDWFMGLRDLRGLWRWVVVWLVIPGGLITLAFVPSYGG